MINGIRKREREIEKNNKFDLPNNKRTKLDANVKCTEKNIFFLLSCCTFHLNKQINIYMRKQERKRKIRFFFCNLRRKKSRESEYNKKKKKSKKINKMQKYNKQK